MTDEEYEPEAPIREFYIDRIKNGPIDMVRITQVTTYLGNTVSSERWNGVKRAKYLYDHAPYEPEGYIRSFQQNMYVYSMSHDRDYLALVDKIIRRYNL